MRELNTPHRHHRPLLLLLLAGASGVLACSGSAEEEGGTTAPSSPTEVTGTPTYPPTAPPTVAPTEEPTDEPTEEPTDEPTEEPTDEVTDPPTDPPTLAPTEEPTDEPTDPPTDPPTAAPTGEPPTATAPPPTPGAVFVLNRPSKSSTVAISNDDSRVIMVNPEDDSISLFDTSANERVARLETGDEPSAVVIHPDGRTAFVANRGDATVVKVDDIDTSNPTVTASLDVGSEPTGLALSPTGRYLFVAEWAEGSVAVIDTTTGEIDQVIDVAGNPRGLAVTNDGDEDDLDESLVVPRFFGTPVEGLEAKDNGRLGYVDVIPLADLSDSAPILFNPRDSGFIPDGTSNGTVTTSPNQLYNIAIQGGRVFVPSISASPQAPARFNGNVYPVVYVGKLAELTEDTSAVGTTNLALKVAEALPTGTRFFLADIVDLDFKGTSNISYVLSRGADVVQRVTWGASSVTLGSTFNTQIDVGTAPQGQSAGCQTPTGIVTAFNSSFAYVNCWVNRRLGVVDLATQTLLTTVESTSAPTGEEAEISAGRRFYFTARGRWSKEGWSGCGSCHPDGLTDNITWVFAAGPRQTTSMDGSFSHGPGPQKQRIFNWTGIFDEIHDFERNTRDVSGGKGAVTTSSTGECGKLDTETAVTLAGGLAQPVKEVQDTTAGVCTTDWDDVEAFSRTIRPPRGLQRLDAASVARGAALFGTENNGGGCVRCHGGAGWTISRRYWTPASSTNSTLAATAFTEPVPPWAPTWSYNTLQIQTQPIIAADATGPAEAAAIAPPQVSCVLRNLGTFGLPGDTTGTDALEKKPDGSRAQGRGGYNVPSLYGMSVGAPYLHHGQARNLQELFEDPTWEGHLLAGNAVFLTSGNVAQQKADLINFILSIDAETDEQAIPTGFDGCPEAF